LIAQFDILQTLVGNVLTFRLTAAWLVSSVSTRSCSRFNSPESLVIIDLLSLAFDLILVFSSFKIYCQSLSNCCFISRLPSLSLNRNELSGNAVSRKGMAEVVDV